MSFPKRVRFALARDGALLTRVLRAFLQVVFAWQRRRVRSLSASSPSVGAVTAIARVGGMANSCPACGKCAHSHCFNCFLKGKAFWWMMARMAGWPSTPRAE